MKTAKTPVKRAKNSAPPAKTKRPGKGGTIPPDGVPFSKKNQPSGEAKSLGWMKKKKGQELAQAIMELAFKGMKNDALKKAAAEYYGVKPEDITVEMMMVFRQAEKAIQKSDTNAFNAVMNRAHGLPKQVQVTADLKRNEDLDLTQFTDDELRQLVELQRKAGISKA